MARSIRTVGLFAVLVALARCSGCGEEEFSCPTGQVLCRGICTDPATYATDPANCGGCGISCGPGACAAGTCDCAGYASCGATANPRCADTQNDPHNCGACGNVCTVANESCSGGTCQCLAPFSPCADGAICTNTQTDPRNCGGCDIVCPLAGDVCVNAECRCPDGDIQCPTVNPTTCVDPATDASNCNGCGIVCSAGRICNARQCVCPSGQTDCSGACVDLATDERNCGQCAKACPATATCTNGNCACPAGPTAGCGGACCRGGSACCGAACPTEHSNGLGQVFFDCAALGTHDATQARSAAAAWQPAGTEIPESGFNCAGFCVGRRTPAGASPAQCATWCYTGALEGRVKVVQSLGCVCPDFGSATWN